MESEICIKSEHNALVSDHLQVVVLPDLSEGHHGVWIVISTLP